MSIRLLCLSLALAILGAGCGQADMSTPQVGGLLATQEVEMDLQLASPAFQAGALIPVEYTCRGSDLSPELTWGEPPAGTKSFALIMDDPDAPAGTFVHWVIFNIPASARGLPASLPREPMLPDGTMQGRMGGRDLGYHGPCPPSGTHRYFFKLYALDTMIDLTTSAGAQDLAKAMEGHILAKGELMGLFKK